MPPPILIKINSKSVAAILKGEASTVEADLQRRGDAIAAKACADAGLPIGSFLAVVDHGRNRLRCGIFTANAEAMVAEANNRTLTRSLDAGRQ